MCKCRVTLCAVYALHARAARNTCLSYFASIYVFIVFVLLYCKQALSLFSYFSCFQQIISTPAARRAIYSKCEHGVGRQESAPYPRSNENQRIVQTTTNEEKRGNKTRRGIGLALNAMRQNQVARRHSTALSCSCRKLVTRSHLLGLEHGHRWRVLPQIQGASHVEPATGRR